MNEEVTQEIIPAPVTGFHRTDRKTIPWAEDEDKKITDMASAMESMRSAANNVRGNFNKDPDPYGYAQELESEDSDIDILPAEWKARPDDNRWNKRLIGRARKAEVSRMFLQGFNTTQIAAKMRVSEATVYGDLENLGQEWRRTYLVNTEELASRNIARLEHLLQATASGVMAGDTKSINSALEIIKELNNVLGVRQGVQVDIEQYIREVAASKGYDPDKAVEIAQRISITMRG